jgi:hypothetical protein
MTGLQMCLLAAKAHGCVIVDGVYNAFKDDDGLAAECDQGRDMGFDGKTLIHPGADRDRQRRLRALRRRGRPGPPPDRRL